MPAGWPFTPGSRCGLSVGRRLGPSDRDDRPDSGTLESDVGEAASDRFAEFGSGGQDRDAIHDVEDRNDVELKPGDELGDPVQESRLVVGLDDGEAPSTVDASQELGVVLIGRDLPFGKGRKYGLAVFM